MATQSYYPPVGFYFKVEFEDLDGINQQDAFFQEVTGLSRELETEQVKSGGENRFTFKLPTRGQYPNLVLKRGYFIGSGLHKWCRDAIEHLDIRPITVLVKILNAEGQPLRTFRCVNAWPQKWSVADLNAQESRIVVENLELVYQYFTIVEDGSTNPFESLIDLSFNF
ncbi:MAG: phage tail protein [Saprospiraceae bacterium]|nr:phage tail protein [Saprospiraceae bacterium]